MTNPDKNNPISFDLDALVDRWIRDAQAFAKNASQIKTREDLRKANLFAQTTEYSTTLTAQIDEEQKAVRQTQLEAYRVRTEALKTAFDQRQEIIQQVAEVQKSAALEAIAGKFVVAGRITDEKTGLGLAGIEVQAFDYDRKSDDWLGKAVTNADGFYRLEYSESDFAESGEGQPEVYVKINDEAGKEIYQSPKGFAYKAGEVTDISIKLAGDKFPMSQALALKTEQFQQAQIAQLNQRKKRLENRLAQSNISIDSLHNSVKVTQSKFSVDKAESNTRPDEVSKKTTTAKRAKKAKAPGKRRTPKQKET